MLLLTLVLGALAVPLMVWQTTALVVERIEVPITGLAPAFDGFVIAHVSDIHGRRLDPSGTLVGAVREAGVDLIAATGDFVRHRASEMRQVTPLIEALAGIAPVYAVSGNHDHWADWPAIAADLGASGAIVLQNQHVLLTRAGGAELVVAGISDPATGKHDLGAAIPARGGTEPGGSAEPDGIAAPVILLAHAPTLHERLSGVFGPVSYVRGQGQGQGSGRGAAWDDLSLISRVALTLCGHTHGGQIKLPLIGAMSNASGRAFPRSYVDGLTWEGDGWLYINRGIGYSIVPLRLLARPELTIITLRVAP